MLDVFHNISIFPTIFQTKINQSEFCNITKRDDEEMMTFKMKQAYCNKSNYNLNENILH